MQRSWPASSSWSRSSSSVWIASGPPTSMPRTTSIPFLNQLPRHRLRTSALARLAWAWLFELSVPVLLPSSSHSVSFFSLFHVHFLDLSISSSIFSFHSLSSFSRSFFSPLLIYLSLCFSLPFLFSFLFPFLFRTFSLSFSCWFLCVCACVCRALLLHHDRGIITVRGLLDRMLEALASRSVDLPRSNPSMLFLYKSLLVFEVL